jgi:hypothetical protein
MKIRPGQNQVVVTFTPSESIAFAQQLIKAAMASGHIEGKDRREPLSDEEEREG